jgi:hypothetical protein
VTGADTDFGFIDEPHAGSLMTGMRQESKGILEFIPRYRP